MSDNVNNPSHYTDGDVECIDALRSALGKEGFEGYCAGAAIKYLWRYRHKGKTVEDLKKAEWYLNRLRRDCEVAEVVNVVAQALDGDGYYGAYNVKCGIVGG